MRQADGDPDGTDADPGGLLHLQRHSGGVGGLVQYQHLLSGRGIGILAGNKAFSKRILLPIRRKGGDPADRFDCDHLYGPYI